MAPDLKKHPCFNSDVQNSFGRIHLPVAPQCNMQCNYCNRKYDCVNETRPGVTSAILTPEQAVLYLDNVIKKMDNLTVVGIAGPGDPFANPDETLRTLTEVRRKYNDMILCLATNGLNIGPYIQDLSGLNISHVTLTINTVDPEIGAAVYYWIRYNKKRYTGIEAAKLLLENQLKALIKLKEHGITVKINSIVIPGINDTHIPEIAKKTAEMGADVLNCIPVHPIPDTFFEDIAEPDIHTMNKIKAAAREYIPLMYHCRRCRADAAGLLKDKLNPEIMSMLQAFSKKENLIGADRPYVAVASEEGFLINRHLGETNELYIYEKKEGEISFVEKRQTPVRGIGDERWIELSKTLKDCSVILSGNSGENPKKILNKNGIQVVVTEGIITDILEKVFKGEKIMEMPAYAIKGCMHCTGDGQGC
ncbi:MAG: nitrogenase cofactor biosynthesis protein NifB [Spirochaetes bacterium]|nr:nitrogenase cofactor biosynthesis protein NifB [Spirochaetota bacterium]